MFFVTPSFIHCVSSADLFRLEDPLSVLFNDAIALSGKVCDGPSKSH